MSPRLPVATVERVDVQRIRCISCGCDETEVIRSGVPRPDQDNAEGRRRRCKSCGWRFNTTERPDPNQ